MKIVRPSVDDHPPLKEWLDKHNAFCIWSRRGKNMEPDVECYRVNAGIAIVLLYKALHGVKAGWSIMTELPSNEISKTLDDAHARTSPP